MTEDILDRSMTAAEMIKYLTKQELEWLIAIPNDIDDVVIFFASGGYFNLTHEELQKIYNLRKPEYD